MRQAWGKGGVRGCRGVGGGARKKTINQTGDKQVAEELNGAVEPGDVAQLVERRTGTPPTQVRFPDAARDFSLRGNFQCRSSYGVRTPPCTIACIYICAHVKDPVVHVRVRWIMETLKHPACTIRLGSTTPSQLAFPRGRQPEFPLGEIPYGQYTRKKVK